MTFDYRKKKSKPVKKLTEKEQLQRRQEDSAAITGKKDVNVLQDFNNELERMAEDDKRKRIAWQKLIGEPLQTIDITDDEVIIETLGFWKVPGGICVYRIDKQGPNPVTERFYSSQFIIKLIATSLER